MTYRTPKEAKAFTCPIARVSGDDPVIAECQAEACMLWRWKLMSAMDPRFMGAVQREMVILQGENPKAVSANLHKEAVRRVAADPQAYTFPDVAVDKGYCGLGGRPQE